MKETDVLSITGREWKYRAVLVSVEKATANVKKALVPVPSAGYRDNKEEGEAE